MKSRGPRFLRLTASEDDDGCVTITAHAEGSEYAGRSQAYFGTRELAAFAAKLRRFPMTGRLSITGGLVRSEYIAIDCYPIDDRGHLGVHVRLATRVGRAERPELQCTVSLELVTTYSGIERFSYAIEGMLGGSVEEAVLVGE